MNGLGKITPAHTAQLASSPDGRRPADAGASLGTRHPGQAAYRAKVAASFRLKPPTQGVYDERCESHEQLRRH